MEIKADSQGFMHISMHHAALEFVRLATNVATNVAAEVRDDSNIWQKSYA